MKIYTEKDIESPSVEVLLTPKELRTLSSALVEFELKIKRYKQLNEGQKDLGFSHLHFQDCTPISDDNQSDIVFYVDLNKD